jgi:polysaccharide export outer membrane protein
MFKAPSSYKYDKLDTTGEQTYKITHGDILRVSLYSNGGYQLLDALTPGSGTGLTQISYIVKDDGYVKLPMIDSVDIQGKSVDEAEKMLQEMYSYYFVKPFVQLTVTNMRVIVFTGPDKGEVVNLQNNSVTLAEVLAQSGGISDNSRAYDIKVIRPGVGGELKIEKVNLSKIANVQKAQMRIFPNDIIYVTPGAQLNTAIGQITPVLSLLITAITLIAFIDTYRQ